MGNEIYSVENINGVTTSVVMDRIRTALLITQPYYENSLRILDCCCGRGEVKKVLSGMEAVSSRKSDIFETDLYPYENSVKKVDLLIDPLPFSNLNTVFMFHALEHFQNPSYVLQKIYDSLISGGYVIIAVPDALYKDDGYQPYNKDIGHLTYFTGDILDKTLKLSGFDVVQLSLVKHDEDHHELIIVGKK